MKTFHGRGVKLNWYGDEVLAATEKEAQKRLAMAGEAVRSGVVENISVPTSSAGPSVPGEFPHADTGKLRQSIHSKVVKEENAVYVGSPLEYAKHLELGTSKMAARPFLLRTVYQMARRIMQIFGGKVK